LHIYLLIYEIIVAGNQLTVDSIAGEVFIFQQDSAPAHRAQDTVALLAHETPRSPMVDVTDLKQRLVEVWSTMKQRVIDEAVDEWRKRLRCCVSAKGGHFEHKL